MTVRTILKYLLESRFLFSRFKIVLLFYDWKFGAGNYSFLSWSNTYVQSVTCNQKFYSFEIDHNRRQLRRYERRYVSIYTNRSVQQQQQSKGQAMDDFRRRLLRKSIIAWLKLRWALFFFYLFDHQSWLNNLKRKKLIGAFLAIFEDRLSSIFLLGHTMVDASPR